MTAHRHRKKPASEPTSLQQLLDRLWEAEVEHQQVTVDAILDSIGTRSFGAILLTAGLLVLAPLVGDIPGVPTVIAIVVFLTAAQLALRRNHIWLPKWLLRQSVQRNHLEKAVKWLRKPARLLDKLTRQRLDPLMEKPGVLAIALLCLSVAMIMPAMELIPFSANGAGLALTAFGLALIARDGLIALVAAAITIGAVGFVGWKLLL